jgi:integrase
MVQAPSSSAAKFGMSPFGPTGARSRSRRDPPSVRTRFGCGINSWVRRPGASWVRLPQKESPAENSWTTYWNMPGINVKASTERIWKLVVAASLRPFFGHRKAATLSTAVLKEYRHKRLAEGRSEATCNRELSMLRTALNLGRKCTPPKVLVVPYFPMVAETHVRQGFLTDEQFELLRDALPDYLRPLFVTGYFTGVRLGELLAIRWSHVDWEQGFITLSSADTKTGHTRAVPILDGDMRFWLEWAHENADGSDAVFHRDGAPIKEFRFTWKKACAVAGVPNLKFHDLRRTAVRNMRRSGVPQVVRMRISGHRTDSMERRYNIVDIEDIQSARELMQKKQKVTTEREDRKE